MRSTPKALLIIPVLLCCVGCDQVTKSIARESLSAIPPIHLLGGVIRLQYTENTGAFLGLGSGLPAAVRFWSFGVFTAVILSAMLWFILASRHLSRVSILGGAMIVGGGLSNLVDRVIHAGAVPDFMNLGVGGLRTGIFNVADMAILAGIGMMLIGRYLPREAENRAA